MDKTITTALLIIISMIMVMMLFNVAYPAVMSGSDSLSNMTYRVEERMSQQISVIHIAAELDSSGWWVDNGNGLFEVFVWVKNIGTARITAIEQFDVFFGAEGNYTRIPHQSTAGGSYPYWSAQVESGTNWSPTATLRITFHYNTALAQGRYYMKVVTPNGVTDEYFVGL